MNYNISMREFLLYILICFVLYSCGSGSEFVQNQEKHGPQAVWKRLTDCSCLFSQRHFWSLENFFHKGRKQHLK